MDAAGLLAAKKLGTFTLTLTLGEGVNADLVLRALPRLAYRELIEAHPPVDDDDKWNPDTFPPALIAACAVEPVFTYEQALELWDNWEDGEAARVFLTAYNLNENPAALNFIWPGSAKTGGSGPNSTTASPSESDTPNS